MRSCELRGRFCVFECSLVSLISYLSGDSCHPMLPYLGQGANSAIEDGVVLGRLLKYVQRKEQIGKALEMYEKLRKSRGDAIVKETFIQVSS